MEISNKGILSQIQVLKNLIGEYNRIVIEKGKFRSSIYVKNLLENLNKLSESLDLLPEIVEVTFDYKFEGNIIEIPVILGEIIDGFQVLIARPDGSVMTVDQERRWEEEVVDRVFKNIYALSGYIERFNPYVFAVRLHKDKNLEITRLLARYKEILPLIENIGSFEVKSQQAFSRAEEAASYIEGKRSELNNDIGKLNSSLKTIEEGRKATNEILEQGKKKLADIEEKLKIQEEQLKDTSEIGNLHEEAKKLIEQSKLALNLKNAEGISAAFASRVHVDGWWNKRLTPWLIGGLVFLIAAAGLSYLLVVDTSIGIESIGKLIGRVIGVGLTVSAAAFCAKQYTKQKNIEEDYHYKAILSKSITTFTEEIKKTDETKLAEYLTQVLSEIHKDPLRERKNDDNGVMDTNLVLEKVLSLVGKVK